MKQAVSTMTMIRSLVDESAAMSMIPNEILFEIFSYLEPSELVVRLQQRAQQQSATTTITPSPQGASRRRKCVMM